jgi:hypothetical protein
LALLREIIGAIYNGTIHYSPFINQQTRVVINFETMFEPRQTHTLTKPWTLKYLFSFFPAFPCSHSLNIMRTQYTFPHAGVPARKSVCWFVRVCNISLAKTYINVCGFCCLFCVRINVRIYFTHSRLGPSRG